MNRARVALVWIVLAIVIAVPIALAANSPLLAWRQPIYIVAGFAGIVAMAFLLVQPLLVGGYLPGLSARQSRQGHRAIGLFLVLAVVVHVVALWIFSPLDVIDALLFVSPTPFSNWGVVAMWAVFAAALLALLRGWLRLRPKTWRFGHSLLVAIAIIGSVVHALLVEGTMEMISKVVFCALVLLAAVKVFADLRVWALGAKPRK